MLLAVDTSTRYIGVALYDGIRVLSENIWLSKNFHTVELAPTVENALKSVGVAESQLTALGVATGPGSFTGLRIGLALVKGLALSLKIPIIGIPTLDILAAAQPVAGLELACVIEAGRNRFAVGWYHAPEGAWQAKGEPENLTIDEFIEKIHGPVRICGELHEDLISRFTDTDKQIDLAPPYQSIRRPAVLAELAWRRFSKGDTDNPATLSPTYLHHGTPIPG
jgi:tRNA threonylcarbamoyladenosine biosynthesis protein TsaB